MQLFKKKMFEKLGEMIIYFFVFQDKSCMKVFCLNDTFNLLYYRYTIQKEEKKFAANVALWLVLKTHK